MRVLPLACTLLLLLVSLLPAQRTRTTVPARPSLPASADTNDARAYYTHAVPD